MVNIFTIQNLLLHYTNVFHKNHIYFSYTFFLKIFHSFEIISFTFIHYNFTFCGYYFTIQNLHFYISLPYFTKITSILVTHFSKKTYFTLSKNHFHILWLLCHNSKPTCNISRVCFTKITSISIAHFWKNIFSLSK